MEPRRRSGNIISRVSSGLGKCRMRLTSSALPAMSQIPETTGLWTMLCQCEPQVHGPGIAMCSQAWLVTAVVASPKPAPGSHLTSDIKQIFSAIVKLPVDSALPAQRRNNQAAVSVPYGRSVAVPAQHNNDSLPSPETSQNEWRRAAWLHRLNPQVHRHSLPHPSQTKRGSNPD